MTVRVHVFADTHTHTCTHTLLTVSRQYGPVLCSEAAACDAAVRAKGDPHCAAVCVDCWWCYVTTEPAGEKDRPYNNLNLVFE